MRSIIAMCSFLSLALKLDVLKEILKIGQPVLAIAEKRLSNTKRDNLRVIIKALFTTPIRKLMGSCRNIITALSHCML